MELELAITLRKDLVKGWVGSVDLPLRKVQGLPLSELVIDDGTFTALISGARSFQIVAKIEEAEGTLRGELCQGPVVLELDLVCNEDYAFQAVSRPQHPVPPYPYRTRDLVAQHPAAHTLAGTLTLPDPERFGPGPYASAVLITGGGREDRDSTALGRKPFLVIADHLTRKGLPVLRFDDRGVGQSMVTKHTPVGKQATSLLLATDTAAVVRRLREEPELDPQAIGLIGHSEGGMIAPLVALLEPQIAFLLLLAGPGAPGAAVFQKQFELDWELQGADASTVKELSKLMEELQAALVLQQPTEDLLQLERGFIDAWLDAKLTGSSRDPEAAARGLQDLLCQFERSLYVAIDTPGGVSPSVTTPRRFYPLSAARFSR
ncbi:MAG: pimeloyl-ACP methyl ester carboxylesterase [Candidatus Paceibacteria bacterium]|jgi:pimeloyl-ACP methyl ester carboxylesterase